MPAMGRFPLVAALAALAAGCGAGRGASGPRGVEAAGLPFRVLAGAGGAEVGEAALARAIDGARAVCVGEHHPSPHDHWVQLRLLDGILARNAARGVATGVGLEMVQRPYQGVLDDYAAGRIDEAALRSRTGWADRWGYDFDLYRPILRLAVRRGAALLALNTVRELTKRVSRHGLDALTAEERAGLPELVLDDAEHRAWWDKVMGDVAGHGGEAGEEAPAPAEAPAPTEAPAPADAPPAGHGHGHGHGVAPSSDVLPPGHPPIGPPADAPPPAGERIYAAQVLWDETMADGAARWLAADPRRQLVILAGSGHCHESAIVRRLERRGGGPAISIRPVIDGADGEVADLLARPIHDFLFVMAPE
jgi:uncharacterized iron-regulated protein